jgi:hypothetical protein
VFRPGPRSLVPLPALTQGEKYGATLMVEDPRSSKARSGFLDDKLRALKQYCRAKGLCGRCA